MNNKKNVDYKKQQLQDLSKYLHVKSDSVGFLDTGDEVTLSLFTKHNKENKINGVIDTLHKNLNNYTKLTSEFVAFKTDDGYLVVHPWMYFGAQEIGTKVHFFNDKEEIKQFINENGYFKNITLFDQAKHQEALQNVEKISDDFDNSLTISNVLKKITSIGRSSAKNNLKL